MGTLIGSSISLEFSGSYNHIATLQVTNSTDYVAASYHIDISDFAFTLNGSSGTPVFLNNLTLKFTELSDLPDFTSVLLQTGAAIPFSWDAHSITMDVSNLPLPLGTVFRLTIGFSPTDISLSNASINENAKGPIVVGTLSNDDFDRTTVSYSIADNPYFNIVGNQIVLKTGAVLDYESMPSYDVRIFATDNSGAKHTISEIFTINVRDNNDSPTLMGSALAPTFVEHGRPVDVFDAVAIDTVEVGETIKSLTLTVSGLVAGDDALLIDGTSIALTAGSLGALSSVGATYSVSRTGDVATITLVTASGMSVRQAEMLLDGIFYVNTSDNPGNGDRVVTVTSLQDSGGTANGGVDTTTLSLASTIHMVPVNDAPTGKDATIALLEDSTYTFSASDFGFSDAAENNGFLAVKITTLPTIGQLVLNDTTGGNAAPVVMQAGTIVPSGFLKFLAWTPDGNANGTGLSSFTFQVMDDGDASNGLNTDASPNTITFNVTAVNDAPKFVPGADLAVAEDSGSQSMVHWATGMTAGTRDEGGQALAFTVTNDNSALFAEQPAIADDGTLTYRFADNANGLATVTVVLSDDGGTANGGKDATSPITFTLTATPLNDAPTAIAIKPLVVNAGKEPAVVENSAGAVIAAVFTNDVDDKTFTYTVDDSRFEIVNEELRLKSGIALDYEAAQSLTLTITATDSGKLSVSRTMTIAVMDDAGDNNTAPVIATPNADVAAQSGTALSLLIGDGHFQDGQGTDLDYVITVNGQTKPAWLSFDAETGLLTGTPTTSDAGTYVIAVTASDGSLVSGTDTFNLIVTNPAAPDTTGDRGNNILIGDDTDNIMDGRRGNDKLTGNGGADTFVFGRHYGRDVIKDFDPSEGDRIDVSGAVGIDTFNDLIKHHVTDIGAHVRIEADDHSILIIQNIEPGELTEDMFVF